MNSHDISRDQLKSKLHAILYSLQTYIQYSQVHSVRKSDVNFIDDSNSPLQLLSRATQVEFSAGSAELKTIRSGFPPRYSGPPTTIRPPAFCLGVLDSIGTPRRLRRTRRTTVPCKTASIGISSSLPAIPVTNDGPLSASSDVADVGQTQVPTAGFTPPHSPAVSHGEPTTSRPSTNVSRPVKTSSQPVSTPTIVPLVSRGLVHNQANLHPIRVTKL